MKMTYTYWAEMKARVEAAADADVANDEEAMKILVRNLINQLNLVGRS